MGKEDEPKKFKLPISKKYYVESLDEVLLIENSPEAYQAILPLARRRQNITGFKPRTYAEANFILPQLKIINNAYENALYQFVNFAESPMLDAQENFKFLIESINDFKETKLNEDQRTIFNDGKRLLDALYPENFGATPAIHSFWFNYIGRLHPKEEIFQIKPDPFAIYLNFHELGVKPVYSYKEEFRIDIPIYNGKGEEFYLGCWSPEEGPLIKEGHFEEQACSNKKALEKGRLIVDNKDNAQERFSFYRPGG